MSLAEWTNALSKQLRLGLIHSGYHSRPKFIIIGAQKAGTTALYYYLAEHPNIVPSTEKEIGFFSPELFQDWHENPKHRILCRLGENDFFDPKTYRTTAAWYHSHFALPHELGSSRITFEATPEYLYYPKVAERIFEYDPNMKLIAVLRHPVERAYSAWNMYRRFGEGDYRSFIYAPKKETRTFEEAIQNELNAMQSNQAQLDPGYVQRGIYSEQLLRYFKFFKRDQILVLDSQLLKDQTSCVIDQVIDFLRLPKYTPRGEWAPFLVGNYDAQIPEAAARQLREFYRPHDSNLYELLDHDFGWQ